MHCQGWAPLRRHVFRGKPGGCVSKHSQAQVSGKSSPCDGSSTNTDVTFGPSIDGDMHKPANIVTLKRPKQVPKPKSSHHCFVEMTGDANLI